MAATSDHPQRRPHRSNGNGKPRSNGNSNDYRQPPHLTRSSGELHDAVIVNALERALVLLPQNEVAERALIGSALVDEQVLDTCSFVKPQYFFQEINGQAWKTLQEMRAAGIRIDMITLMEAFTAKGLLDDAGGIDTILAYANGVPHAGHAKDYAKIICEKYLSRYSQTVNSTLNKAGARGDPGEIAAAWTASYTEMQEIFVALGIAVDGTRAGPRHQLLTLAEMRNRPRPEWIIPGFLHERKRNLIFGDSNTGKSFIASDLGLCIATGRAWHGHAIQKPGAVVYVCAEGADDIMNRVDVWLEHHGLEDAPNFWIVEDSPNLLEHGDVAGVIERIKNTLDDDPVLVIFDTLAASMTGGNENDALDMGIVIGAVHRVQRECNCGVLVVHHSGKDDTKGPRGNSSLRADVDLAIKVSMEPETGIIAMNGDKWRSGDKRKISYGFRLVNKALDQYADLTSCILEATSERPAPVERSSQSTLTNAPGKLFALMQEIGQPHRYGEWERLFAQERKLGSSKTYQAAMADLKKRHLTTQFGEMIGAVTKL